MAHPRRRVQLCWSALVVVMFVCGWLLLPKQPTAYAHHDTPTLPTGYSDIVLAAIPDPIALAFTPDGRLLITTRYGYLRVYQNDLLLSTPALDLSQTVCSTNEMGMIGIATDPNFASNRFIYLYYTYKKYGGCELKSAQSPVNRLSRFVLSDANTVDPVSEVVLLDNIPSTGGIHNAGDLRFGKDGYLYVSVGDGGCDYILERSGCGKDNQAARDTNILLGKILRIAVNPDGSTAIPPSNPFQGTDSARCNLTARTEPGKWCQETYAWGLRNPFRTPHDPNAAGTRFFINDVGQGTWEEIDQGQSGADYGWSVREGPCANNSKTNCGPPPAGMINPIYAYQHNTVYPGNGTAACNAIAAGTFVPNGTWSGFDGAYLYSDYVCGAIFKLVPTGNGYTSTPFVTNMGVSTVVGMLFGPSNGKQSLYYTSFAHGGRLRRIDYVDGANRVPNAAFDATPSTGDPPLEVSFDGSASTDPDGDALTYLWNFGDGLTEETSSPQTTHTYAASGVFNASLRVRDSRGAVSSISEVVRIDVGNTPPTPIILAPSSALRFKVGQRIALQGRATDAEDGTLADSRLTWQMKLVHNEHTHPFLPPTVGNNVEIIAPAPEDLAPETVNYLEITLTATDSQGRATTVIQNLLPNRVKITFATQPTNMQVYLNGSALAAPQTISSWEGFPLNVDAPTQATISGQWLLFKMWSDGGVARHTIVTPATDAVYTATYTAARRAWLPVVQR